MNVIVVGAGYVGLVASCCMAQDGHQVTCIENNREKLDMLKKGICPIYEKGLQDMLMDSLVKGWLSFKAELPDVLQGDIIIVAVSTPSSLSGATDLSSIHEVMARLSETVQGPAVVVMKSTVPPGTGRMLKANYFVGKPVSYVSSPEFLREGQAVFDWYNPSRIVIGTEDAATASLARRLYPDIDVPVVITDISSAEMIKYASNAFLATKISFVNEVANFCELIDADIDDVALGMGLDGRIGPHFLKAGAGYGGSCFPKDARALDYYCMNTGYDFQLIKSCIEVNTQQRLLIVQKLRRMLGGIDGKKITLLGLAFKPGTDDVRESPAIGIAHLLSKEGARLTVCDPVALDKAGSQLPDNIVLNHDIIAASRGAQAICLLTEWPQFIHADWKSIRDYMSAPYVVVDGRNSLDRQKLDLLGFMYCGVGRKLSSPVSLCQ